MYNRIFTVVKPSKVDAIVHKHSSLILPKVLGNENIFWMLNPRFSHSI